MSGIQDNYKLTNQTVISYTNSSTGSLINSSLTSVGNISVSRDHYVNLVRTTPNPNDYLKQISFVLEYSTQWIDLPNIYFLNNLVSSAVIHISCSVLNNSDSSIYKSAIFEILLERIGSEWTSTSSFSGDITGVVFKSSQAYDSINGDYCKIQYKNTNNSDNYTTSVDIKCKTISSFGTFKDSPVSGNYESFYTNLTNKTPNNFLLSDSSGNVILQDVGITTNENDDVETSSNIVMNNNKTPVDVRGDTTVNRNLITNNKITKARYFRIDLDTTTIPGNGGYNLNIMEIEIYNDEGVNIARNSVPSMSDTYSIYRPSNLIDGNINTMGHTYRESHKWMQLDLKQDENISYVKIFNRPYYYYRMLHSIVKLINNNNEIVFARKILNERDIYTLYPTNIYFDKEFTISNNIYKNNENLLNNKLLSCDYLKKNSFRNNEYYPESTTGTYYISDTDNSYFYIDTEGIQYIYFRNSSIREPLYIDNKRILGAYFIIEMPQAIEIKSIELLKINHVIQSFYIAGSNDGYNYTNLVFAERKDYSWSGYTGDNTRHKINFTTTGSYKFYQLRVVECTYYYCYISRVWFHTEFYDFETNTYPQTDSLYPPIRFPRRDVYFDQIYSFDITENESLYGTGTYTVSQSSSWSGGAHAYMLFYDYDETIDHFGWRTGYDFTGFHGFLVERSKGEHYSIFTRDLVVCNVYGGLRFRTQKEKDSIPDMIISSSGNFGLGIEEPGFLLELSKDSAYNTNNSVWDTLSDISVKKNVENADLQICLDNIKNIPLKTWTLKKELADIYSLDLNKTSLGVTAQDTESILPKSIRTTKKKIGNLTYEDFKYLDSDQVFWNLYGAVQNLVSRVQNILNKI